jgi:protein TonB
MIAAGSVAVMLIVMNRTAPSRADAVANAPTAVEAPAPTPEPSAEPAPSAAPSERAAEARPAADEEPPAPRERAGSPQASAERARRAVAEPTDQAVRVGGRIPQPTKIRNVLPDYPPIAQSARIQGTVIIEATIDRQGRIAEARVLRSIPLLDQAALDAVRQWEYEPTLLNGVAVPVIVTVTVNFTLG